MVILKWTNVFSNETGFVKSISNSERHFINTYNADEAKKYSGKTINNVLAKLKSFGETENNVFEVVNVD
jgi:hypothetical protein